MKQKKSKIIIILIIIVILVIILASLGIAYFATDLFKSNKTLFAKYAGQIADENQGFIENALQQYNEKKQSNTYSDKGTFSVNASANSSTTNLDNVNKFNVTYTGQVDTTNSKSEQNVSINYSDSVKFPVNYKKIGNKIGLQTDYVGSKYIGIESDKMEKLSLDTNTINSSEAEQTSSNVDINEIKDGTTELKNILQNPFSQEDIVNIKNNIISIMDGISDSKFSNINDSNGKGYKLVLSGDDLKNVVIQLLQKLSQDTETLDKINEYLQNQGNSNKLTATQIEKEITNITNNSDFDNETLELTVYKKNGKTNKFIIKIEDLEIDVEKNNSNNNIEYNVVVDVNYNNEKMKISLKTVYQGLETMQQVNENYELSIENSQNTYIYHLTNVIDFTQTKEIEDFTSDNSLILTDYDKDVVSNFLVQVGQRIQEVNSTQMAQLGIEESDNPILHLIPSFGTYSDIISNMNTSQINEQDVNTFNQKFELYESTNLGGATVKGLLTTINLNNESQEENRKIEEINFNGQEYEASTQNIAFIKEDIKTDAYYRVEFEKDQSTGLIYRAVINPK